MTPPVATLRLVFLDSDGRTSYTGAPIPVTSAK
jgi:hypothetical protein